MAMKGYSQSPKIQHYWSLTTSFFCVISLWESYPSAEMQSVYSTALADCANSWWVKDQENMMDVAKPYIPN